MKIRVIIGAFMAAMLLGVGVLAGSLMGTGNVSAQTPTQSATAAPSAPKADTTPGTSNPGNQGNPGNGKGNGGMRGPGGPGGFGPGGRGGPGPGGFGPGGFVPGGYAPQGEANANAATREISSTTNLITQVKSDLAYANGKMDTTDLQKWVDGADSLLKNAQDANSASKYGSAVAYARAASELAGVAEGQMAQKLGASNLPSYSQRPQFRRPNNGNGNNNNGKGNGNGTTTPTVTQVEASRILANTYSQLVSQGALIKNASNAGDAATYLTDAQNAYSAAYNSYQSGNYSDAVSSARLAQQLEGVANAVLQATNAANDNTTPVTVPAPNF